jgi:hypothetical protein
MLGSKLIKAAAGAAGGENLYIEDVFSTYLYAGNGTTLTITNGIDLAGEGGMVWSKPRSYAGSHNIYDTERGVGKRLASNLTSAEGTLSDGGFTAFNSDGFVVTGNAYDTNISFETFASWTFRKAPKFFDVVTWTGTGTQQDITHNLGSIPGCIIVKRTSSTEDWAVYHRSLNGGVTPYNYFLRLNATLDETNNTTRWVQAPTATDFTVGTHTEVNTSGQTYVAYLFAHDAGGFGDDGEQNVISCGSFTLSSGSATVTLGYEPQFVIFKPTSTTGDWLQVDTMRGGFDYSAFRNYLRPNLSAAEDTFAEFQGAPTSTGFTLANLGGSSTYIYIAIRRGPMKTPESGTEVFAIDTLSATPPSYTSGFPIDMAMNSTSSISSSFYNDVVSRLTGTKFLRTSSTAAESSETYYKTDFMTGWDNRGGTNSDQYSWMFRRAPGFMDVCCYTGTGVARTVAHNLGVVPEMIIGKRRNNLRDWSMYAAPVGNDKGCAINDNASFTSTSMWNEQTPTNSVFYVNGSTDTNQSGDTYIAYLFATLAGVSKVGSYTGTGTTLQINCGFSAGARFVLIKRTDSTGDWYVWDSARGIIAGNDPYLLLNSTAVENTSTDYIDPLASGFEISSTAPAAINASGGNFIFLAIA